MIGDRLNTDILFGKAGSLSTLLVLTGRFNFNYTHGLTYAFDHLEELPKSPIFLAQMPPPPYRTTLLTRSAIFVQCCNLSLTLSRSHQSNNPSFLYPVVLAALLYYSHPRIRDETVPGQAALQCYERNADMKFSRSVINPGQVLRAWMVYRV